MTHGKRQRERNRERRFQKHILTEETFEIPAQLIKPTLWQKVKKWITELIS